jgi:phosphoglycerate dehydrogenase-like enzyme
MTGTPPVNVLVLSRLTPEGLESVRKVAPERLCVIDGWPEFQDELQKDWPSSLLQRSSAAPPTRKLSDAERDHVMRTAEVALLGYPYPRHLTGRLPNLKWAHLGGAGVSSLAGSDWWASGIPTTSSRGHTNAEAIAETAMAAIFMFSKRLDLAALNSKAGEFAVPSFGQPRRLASKTMGIVGVGGIGSNVARLGKACGMRVIGTRRSISSRQTRAGDVDVLFPLSELNEMLAETDFLVVAAMLTDETAGMIGERQFEALKQDAFLVNIARGEIVDEAPFVAAITSGKLAGAYLDVWKDDMWSPPSEALRNAPNIVFTPHISGRSDVASGGSLGFFCENLALYLRGEPLYNLVDWSRGY